jgi:hypothetical protein
MPTLSPFLYTHLNLLNNTPVHGVALSSQYICQRCINHLPHDRPTPTLKDPAYTKLAPYSLQHMLSQYKA